MYFVNAMSRCGHDSVSELERAALEKERKGQRKGNWTLSVRERNGRDDGERGPCARYIPGCVDTGNLEFSSLIDDDA